MRAYKHWLLIDGKKRQESIRKQWENLREYLSKYPDSRITVFNKEVGSIFDKVFCLETHQCYDELDLDCNSFFDGSLIRLERKPPHLSQTKDFEFLYQIYGKHSV